MKKVVFAVPHDAPKRVLPFLQRTQGQLKRDLAVASIVADILVDFPGQMVRGLVPRTYADYNRPEELAFADPGLKFEYEKYHETIRSLLRGGGTLFDMHGFASGKEVGRQFDLILSSNGGETMLGKRIDLLLAAELRQCGYAVFAAATPADVPADNIFRTGHTTIRYYLQGIPSLQVEISDRFRQKETRELGQKLSRDLAQALKRITF